MGLGHLAKQVGGILGFPGKFGRGDAVHASLGGQIGDAGEDIVSESVAGSGMS